MPSSFGWPGWAWSRRPTPTATGEAALVGIAATGAGEVIFDSAATARKIANIAANPRVALVVGWDDDVSVQVEGLEEFTIVRVTPRWPRYYDARPECFHVTEGNWPPPVEQGSPGRG